MLIRNVPNIWPRGRLFSFCPGPCFHFPLRAQDERTKAQAKAMALGEGQPAASASCGGRL